MAVVIPKNQRSPSFSIGRAKRFEEPTRDMLFMGAGPNSNNTQDPRDLTHFKVNEPRLNTIQGKRKIGSFV